MKKQINLKGAEIQYELQRKNVKNINLRIKPDGTVYVSANRWVPEKVIEDFLQAKADFVLSALGHYREAAKVQSKHFFDEGEIEPYILDLCEMVYPYFERCGVEKPEIKFKSMVSRWGSCSPTKKILCFNLKLMYAPPECVEYVVMHEFTHFLQANHSKKFYAELEKICPDWKEKRKRLKEINIR